MGVVSMGSEIVVSAAPRGTGGRAALPSSRICCRAVASSTPPRLEEPGREQRCRPVRFAAVLPYSFVLVVDLMWSTERADSTLEKAVIIS